MGQIIGSAAKPKRCNLNQLSQFRTPAAGEYILVSSDNSMSAAGQGNFDCYVVGDGTTTATALPLRTIATDEVERNGKNAVTSGGVYNALPNEEVQVDTSGSVTGAMRITNGVVAYNSSDTYKVVGLDNPIHLKKGDLLTINNGVALYSGGWCSCITQVTGIGDNVSYICLVKGNGTTIYQYAADSDVDVIVCTARICPISILRLAEVVKKSEVTSEIEDGSNKVITSGGVYNILPKRDETISLSDQVQGGMRITNNVVAYNNSDTYYVVGLTTPIHLNKGDVITINNGQTVYASTWCSVFTEVVNNSYSVLVQGTGFAVYQYTAPRDMDVIVCKDSAATPIKVNGITSFNGMLTWEDVDDTLNNESTNPISNKAVSQLLVTSAMKSSIYPSGTGLDVSTKRFFTKGRKNNSPYVEKQILEINIRAGASGQISLIKGVFNSTFTQLVDGTYEVLQTFSVVQGLNKLVPTNPIILSDNEFLGIDGNVRIYYGGYVDNSTNFYWYNSNTGAYAWSDKEMDVEIVVSKVPAYGIDINEINNAIEDNANKIDATDKLLDLPFLDNPCYYHWNPNGFTDNIPSQSVEDNMLAKRLGFTMVEVNQQATATTGKYVITHGNSGKFGQEFNSTYADVLINSMSYNDIVQNVKYNSAKACYNHTISTPETFFKNCAQLGLGVYLRTNNAAIVNTARKYIQDNKIVIEGGASVRSTYNFVGLLTSYIGEYDSSTICNLDYLRAFVAARGGVPYHIVLLDTHVEYMIVQGTLETIVSTLRSEGIYIGVCYASGDVVERLTAVGGVGHAAQQFQCNPFSDANLGAWSPLDSDLSQWNIAEGITGISDGKLVNDTNASLVVQTPSTGVIPLGKGQVQARIKGSVTFTFGGKRGGVNNISYTNYDEDTPINLNAAGIVQDMRLAITIGANSSVEFLNYQASRC